MKKNLLTRELYNELISQKEWLEKEAIPTNSEAIQKAREQGDLSENAEYHEAKDLHAKLHHELETINNTLEHAEIIEEITDTRNVQIGHWITFTTIHNEITMDKTLQLIGQWDNKFTSISSDSLLGSALLGKEVGETFTINPPAGPITITIQSIEIENAQR
ncbi:GreA/GreB family elongation factor [Bacillus bombysepticus]|uniref:GreA/GreB family elongation factor n=1 Tax=Bacillus bombysepticus TaxID=658666 RepID=UPI00301B64D4